MTFEDILGIRKIRPPLIEKKVTIPRREPVKPARLPFVQRVMRGLDRLQTSLELRAVQTAKARMLMAGEQSQVRVLEASEAILLERRGN